VRPRGLDTPRAQRIAHRIFEIGLALKGVDGALEIAGGTLLFFVTPAQLYRMARVLTWHELTEDPHDLVANLVLHGAQHLTAGAALFGALYLVGHGVVKVGLVGALLGRRRWAYPAAIAVFLLFLAFQLYRYTYTASAALLALSVLDVVVIALTWREYRALRTAATTT
jgi:uncharacterized membrane protein